MGIYAFRRTFLHEQLRRDAMDPHSGRDFGRDIIPFLVQNGRAIAHRFTRSCVRSEAETETYWRDVGTVDAYYEANIDLTDTVPALDLFDQDWPIWSYAEITPPAKFVHDTDERRGEGISSLVSGGCIVSGSTVRRSLLFTGVRPFVRHPRERGGPALSRSDAAPACVSHRSRRTHPGGTRDRRRPRARFAAVPPYREGHLPRDPGDDRSTVPMSGAAR
jgi:hypothetical protein